MKYIASIFTLTLFLFSQVYSQNTYEAKLPNLEPYTGTWAGSNDADSLVVMLESKEKYFEPLDITIDQLVGKFSLFKNGKLITKNFDSTEYTLTVGSLRRDSKNKISYLSFIFSDLEKNKHGHLKLTFTDSTYRVINWQLRVPPGLYLKETTPDDFREFSVPKEITMRKIE